MIFFLFRDDFGFIIIFQPCERKMSTQVAWPSGLRRWIKAPVSSEAWVRIPPLSDIFLIINYSPLQDTQFILKKLQ